jgi:hypothetical protein
MLLMVMLKATTEDTGASSAVVKICACVFCGGVVDGDELTPLQAAKIKDSVSSPESDKNRFIVAPENQNLRGSCKLWFSLIGTQVILGSLHYFGTDYGRNCA